MKRLLCRLWENRVTDSFEKKMEDAHSYALAQIATSRDSKFDTRRDALAHPKLYPKHHVEVHDALGRDFAQLNMLEGLYERHDLHPKVINSVLNGDFTDNDSALKLGALIRRTPHREIIERAFSKMHPDHRDGMGHSFLNNDETPAHIISSLVTPGRDDTDSEMAAGHPNTHPDILRGIWEDAKKRHDQPISFYVPPQLASNPNLPHDIMDELHESPLAGDHTNKKLENHPNKSPNLIRKEYSSVGVRQLQIRSLAQHRNTPPDVLEHMAENHPNWWREIAQNSNTPTHVLSHIDKHANPETADIAKDAINKRLGDKK